VSSRIVITGAGLISPIGNSPTDFYDALCAGRSALGPLDISDADLVDCRQACQMKSFDARLYLDVNLHGLSRISQMVSAAAGLALADSGWTAPMRSEEELAISLGTVFGSVHTISEFDRRALTAGPNYVRPVDFANTVLNAPAGQAAILYDLRGANSTIAAGLTSGLQAIGMASEMIESGTAAGILAGGADEICLESIYGFDRAGLLCHRTGDNPEAPIPFDRRRNGLALGEAAALLMLEDVEAAVGRSARVLGEILGFASGYDCTGWKDRTKSITLVAHTIRAALDDAEVEVDQIAAVSASANGSVYLDDIEARAIGAAFGERAAALPVTAIKSVTGETLGSSGALQTITMLQAMDRGVLPGIFGFGQPPDGFPLLMATIDNTRLDPGHCLINSIGIDGDCSALVLGRARQS
jgi:3-oxoacyl-[acyl-carrier-protein] synthase II